MAPGAPPGLISLETKTLVSTMTRTPGANLVDEIGDFVIARCVWLVAGTWARHQIVQLLARRGLIPGLDDEPAPDALLVARMER